MGGLGRVWTVDGHIRVVIILAYSRDYGSCTFTQHRGDLERVAVELEPLSDETWLLTGLYTASHEGTTSDGGLLLRGRDLVFPEHAPDAQGVRWVVYASGSKHATYMTRAHCEAHSGVPCFAEFCPGATTVDLLFPVVNAGEPGGAIDPLEAMPRTGEDFAFAVFAGERAWVERPFCGGLGGSPCSGSLRAKLLRDPFAAP